MQKIYSLDEINMTKGTAVTLGKFDGIHLGHKELIENLKMTALEKGLKTVVFTFDMSSFSFDQEPIFDSKKKERILEEMGIDIYVCVPFDEKISHISADDFIRDILVGALKAEVIISGEDFRFGFERKGDKETLRKYMDIFGYEYICIPKLKYEGSEISSTRIRTVLKEGNIEAAEEMLGRKL